MHYTLIAIFEEIKKKSCLKVLLCFFVLHHVCTPFAFAQTTQSNRVNTRVGDAPIKTGGDNIISAANIIFEGYKKCAGGFSYDAQIKKDAKDPTRSCLIVFLEENNYGDLPVSAFETTRKRGLVDNTGQGVCNECLPYVATVLALASGDGNALNFGNPRAVLERAKIKETPTSPETPGFSLTTAAGTQFYKPVGGTDPQPGDIGITITSGQTSNTAFGHILIVNSIDERTGEFSAFESNWGPHCSIRNDVTHPIKDKDHPNGYYIFYREQ